jgi:serine protease Do
MARKLNVVASVCLLLLFAPALLAQSDVKGNAVADAGQSESVSKESSTEPLKSISLEFLNLGDAPKSIEQLRAMEEHVAELVQRVEPAVVNVRVGDAQGSGVVVDRYGTVLTAAHVIGGPNLPAQITFPDGKTVDAQTLGVNRRADTGMLKITEEGRYPYLDTGESELLNRGQWVMAIGHPGGIDKDRGLVVRVGRLLGTSQNVLRTDCTLVGGDSGGPLIDMDGYVIGIHSRIGGSLSDNIHVPIDAFQTDWDQLVDAARVGEKPRANLGLNLVDDTNEIESVADDGPAAKAGLKKGDKIIKFDDTEIENKRDVSRAYGELQPGDKIKIVVQRGDDELTLDLTVGERW